MGVETRIRLSANKTAGWPQPPRAVVIHSPRSGQDWSDL